MKETLQIWGKIFTSPSEGYRRLTAQTKVALPLLFILLLSVAVGALMLPVVTSDAYREATLRAGLEVAERQFGRMTDADRETAAAQMNSPLNRNITLISNLLGSPVMMMLTITLGALVLMLGSIMTRGGITFGAAFRLFIFTAPVLLLQGIVRVVILLASDYTTRLNSVTTMRDFTNALGSSLSVATFIPAGSLPFWLFTGIEYVTDIFNIIFFVFLYYGVRAATREAAPGKAVVPVAITAGAGLFVSVGMALLSSLVM